MHCRTDVCERAHAAAVARRTAFSSRALVFCAGSSSWRARRARSLNAQLRSATLPATVRPPRRQTSSHLPLVFARFRSSYGLQRFTCGLVLAFATSWQHLQFAVRDLREPICNSRSNFRFATPIPELRCARQRNVQTFAHSRRPDRDRVGPVSAMYRYDALRQPRLRMRALACIAFAHIASVVK